MLLNLHLHLHLYWTISCLIPFAFILDNQHLPLVQKAQAIIIQILYLCQSIIPFDIITQNIIKTKSFYTKMLGVMYATICFIVCIVTIIINIHSYLIFILNLTLECFFITTGLALYYNMSSLHPVDTTAIPIVAYIMIRPIIIAFVIPVLSMDIKDQQSVNYFVGYISCGIIAISVLAVLTMVMPFIYDNNSSIQKDGYDVQSGNKTFAHVETYCESLNDGVKQQNKEAKSIDIMDIIAPKFKTLSPNTIKQKSTMLRLSSTTNTYTHQDTLLSIPSLPPESTAGATISIDRRDTNTYEPEYSKESQSKSVPITYVIRKFPSTANSSTYSSTSNNPIESTKYSHFYSDDTNKVLGSGLQEIHENDEQSE